MNKHAATFFVLTIFLSLISLLPSTAAAKAIGAERAPCCETCCESCQGGTVLAETTCKKGTCDASSCDSGSCSISNAKGSKCESYPVFSDSCTGGSCLGLSINYTGNNANGEVVSLDTGIGFGWSHSYNVFLYSQSRDLFKMDSAGRVTKYQRSGRSGPLSTLPGTQQDIAEQPDGSIVINNWQGGTSFTFKKIPGNPIRVAAVEPWMLTTITDRNGNKTQLTYQNGLLDQVTDAYGRQIKFEYDARKHLSKITDPLGRVTQFKYGGYNDLTKITDPLGNAVHYQYDVRHQIVKKTQKNGNQWQYKYDASGHPIEVIDHAGQSVLKLSNPDNWATNSSDLTVQKLRTYIPSVTTLTDGRGNQWQYFYNANGQITKTVAPDNATTTYTYDPATLHMASMTDANGHTTLYEYDGFGNLVKQIDANGNEVRYEYDNPFN